VPLYPSGACIEGEILLIFVCPVKGRAGDKTPMFSTPAIFPGSHRPSQRCRRGCLASHFQLLAICFFSKISTPKLDSYFTHFPLHCQGSLAQNFADVDLPHRRCLFLSSSLAWRYSVFIDQSCLLILFLTTGWIIPRAIPLSRVSAIFKV